jgi:hypothetical protein
MKGFIKVMVREVLPDPTDQVELIMECSSDSDNEDDKSVVDNKVIRKLSFEIQDSGIGIKDED